MKFDKSIYYHCRKQMNGKILLSTDIPLMSTVRLENIIESVLKSYTLLVGRYILAVAVLSLISCKMQRKETITTAREDQLKGHPVEKIDSSIWAIHHDKKGSLWFGSNGKGIYRYNGKSLEQFTVKDGLAGDQIRGIEEDHKGNLFFNTTGGITKFDGTGFTTLNPVRAPRSLWRLQPDDIWFKGSNERASALRYDGETLYHLEFSDFDAGRAGPAYDVYSLYRDKAGNIWFGTLFGGVCKFDGNGLQWIFEGEMKPLDDGRVPGIRSILEDSDGHFWFSNILYKYRVRLPDFPGQIDLKYTRLEAMAKTQQNPTMQLPYYTSAITDQENIWMTNYNEGIWKYDGTKLTNYRIRVGAKNVLVMTVYLDRDGGIWVGTDNDGVYKFNSKDFEKFHFHH